MGHEKKKHFLFFGIFIFTLFIGIFRFFPYIILVNFSFQATGHSLSSRIMIFGLREPCNSSYSMTLYCRDSTGYPGEEYKINCKLPRTHTHVAMLFASDHWVELTVSTRLFQKHIYLFHPITWFYRYYF